MQTFLEYVKGRAIERKKVDKIGEYKVYTINTSGHRTEKPDLKIFRTFGTHLSHPDIVPNKEIWINQDIRKEHQQFFIINGINQYEGEKLGRRSWQEYADKKEKAMKEKVINQNCKPHIDLPSETPKKLYDKYCCGIPTPDDDVEVWLVDGDKVRKHFKSYFFEAGSGEVYKWIPRQEIWIEKTVKEEERPALILHEYVEATLMKEKKLDYVKADVIAHKVCWLKRKSWDIVKVKALCRHEALDLAKRYL